MKHYFNSMSRALTSDWMLKELDAEHERIVIDIQAGEQNSPEYRAINPMGKVPTLVDDDIVISSSQVPPLNRFCRSPRLVWKILSHNQWGGVICRVLWPQSSR